MTPSERALAIPAGTTRLEGDFGVPKQPLGVVLFAHGSGSSRHSPRNRFVAGTLREAGLATLLMDLLSPQEDSRPQTRFDIDLLTDRLSHAVRYLASDATTANLRVGIFGASTGAAAALRAAARMPREVAAVVSRGGRPDLAGTAALRGVKAPTLLIVGGADEGVIELNRDAYAELACDKRIEVVPGATHLFEEPGALQEVARLAAEWFGRHLTHGGTL